MDIVILIVVAIGALGVGALVAGYFDRKHATEEARKVRHFNRRADAYQAISISLSDQESFVMHIEHPTIKGVPDLMPDEGWRRLGGITARLLRFQRTRATACSKASENIVKRLGWR